MSALGGKRLFLCLAVLLGVYFPLSIYSKLSYRDPAPPGSLVVQLVPPFQSEGGLSWRVTQPLPPAWLQLAGAEPATLFEDGWPLLERDSYWTAIRDWGHGRFLIESAGAVIMFSTSDGTDPNRNGRRYWLVVP